MHECMRMVFFVPSVSSSKLGILRQPPHYTAWMEREKKWGQGGAGAEILFSLPQLSVANLECQINHPKSDQETRGGTEWNSPSGDSPQTCCQVGMLLHVLSARLSPLPLPLVPIRKEDVPKGRRYRRKVCLSSYFLLPNVCFMRTASSRMRPCFWLQSLKRRRGNNDPPSSFRQINCRARCYLLSFISPLPSAFHYNAFPAHFINFGNSILCRCVPFLGIF